MNNQTRDPSYLNYPSSEWQGSRPAKFKPGGRKHNNHPLDELDNFMLGNLSGHTKMLGPSKRRFEEIATTGKEEVFKPRIKVNADRMNSNVFYGNDVQKYQINSIKENTEGHRLVRSQILAESNVKDVERERSYMKLNRSEVVYPLTFIY